LPSLRVKVLDYLGEVILQKEHPYEFDIVEIDKRVLVELLRYSLIDKYLTFLEIHQLALDFINRL
jgi:hypothetical protein